MYSGSAVAAKCELAVHNGIEQHLIEYQWRQLRANEPSRRSQAYDERRQVTAEAMAAAAEEGGGTPVVLGQPKRQCVSRVNWVYVPVNGATGAIQPGSKAATEIANHVRMVQGRSHDREVQNMKRQIDFISGKLEQSQERIEDLNDETAELRPLAKKAKTLATTKDKLTQKLGGKEEEVKEKKREVRTANHELREEAKRARSAELTVERTEGKLEAAKAKVEDADERAKEKCKAKVERERPFIDSRRSPARIIEIGGVQRHGASAS